MRVLITLLALVALALAQAPKPCASPREWNANYELLEPEQRTKAEGRFFYDASKQRIARFVYEFHNSTYYKIWVIENFATKTQYVINLNEKDSCVTSALTYPFRPLGVPAGARSEGLGFIGTAALGDGVEIESWNVQHTDGYSHLQFTQKTCLPVRAHQHFNNTDRPSSKIFSMYDVTPQESPENVFTPPAFCKQSSTTADAVVSLFTYALEEVPVTKPQLVFGVQADSAARGPQLVFGVEADSAARGPQLVFGVEADSAARGPQLVFGVEADSAARAQFVFGVEADSAARGPQLVFGVEADSAVRAPQSTATIADLVRALNFGEDETYTEDLDEIPAWDESEEELPVAQVEFLTEQDFFDSDMSDEELLAYLQEIQVEGEDFSQDEGLLYDDEDMEEDMGEYAVGDEDESFEEDEDDETEEQEEEEEDGEEWDTGFDDEELEDLLAENDVAEEVDEYVEYY